MNCFRNTVKLIGKRRKYAFVRGIRQTCSAWTLTLPQVEDRNKTHSPKLEQIVTEIAKLNLLEVAELSNLLKQKLNLPDAPVYGFGQVSAAAAANPAPVTLEPVEEEKPVEVSYTVKLVKFDDKQKIALIKEIKNVMEGMNLVQAKKFVESVPTVVKADISKIEADKLKEILVKVGAEIEITS